MAKKLDIQFVENSFYIDKGQTTNGELKIQIKNDTGEDIPCKMVKIKIPYGNKVKSLTSSNDFSVVNMEYWSEPEPPFEEEDDFVCIYFENNFDSFESGLEDIFHIYNIPINPNKGSKKKRTVKVEVECFENIDDEVPLQKTEKLSFALQTQGEDPVPFINYFAVKSLDTSGKKNEVELVWEISHGKTMTLNHVTFDRPHPFLVTKSLITPIAMDDMKKDDEGTILLKDADASRPILIEEASGSQKFKLYQSTQFTLVADNENQNKRMSQIEVYLKELTIYHFAPKDYSFHEPFPYLEPLTVEWTIGFEDIRGIGNEVWLGIKEYDNKGKALPMDKNIIARYGNKIPDSLSKCTRIITKPEFALAHRGTFIYYPVRPTEFILHIIEPKLINPNAVKSIKTIMITSNVTPIGSITMFMGNNIPTGWRLCDGKFITRNSIRPTFDELAKVLGQDDDTDDKLRLPNLRDRFPVSTGARTNVGQIGGPDPVQHHHKVDPKPKTFSTSWQGAHSHSYIPKFKYQDADNDDNDGRFNAVKELHLPKSTGRAGGHRHSVKVDIPITQSTGPLYSTNSTTNRILTQKAKLNRPHYYPLNFIIRVS